MQRLSKRLILLQATEGTQNYMLYEILPNSNGANGRLAVRITGKIDSFLPHIP